MLMPTRMIRDGNPVTEINDLQSPFLGLIGRLESWHQNLPEIYRATPSNLSAQADGLMLANVYFLHFLFNATLFDLTRISLPGFNFPLSAAFRRAPPAFRAQCQARCRHHADQVPELIRQGMVAGKDAFRDPFCTHAAFESLKILIVHSATSNSPNQMDMENTAQNIKTNLNFMGSILQFDDISKIYVGTVFLATSQHY